MATSNSQFIMPLIVQNGSQSDKKVWKSQENINLISGKTCKLLFTLVLQ